MTPPHTATRPPACGSGGSHGRAQRYRSADPLDRVGLATVKSETVVGDRQSFLSGRTPSHAKVLISDSLSPRAVEIFRERGVEVDVKTGLKPEELKAIIGEYDGLAIRRPPR